jgi:hypothetical protein
MSAFLELQSFRKSGLLKKGDAPKIDMSSYQDPTYLSFTLLFDMNLFSPLFNGEAEGFIKKHLIAANPAKYQHKLDSLIAFKEALYKINTEMSWHWQTLAGVDRLLQFTPENAFFGGNDAKLTIGCLETINLNIAGLMQLYRKAVWDETRWTYILPPNLRKFNMYVFISDVRSIYDNAADGVLAGANLKPFFMFDLRLCEFDMTSGNKFLGDLSAAAPEVATNEIVINYNRVFRVDARALNGIVFQSPDISRKDVKDNPVGEKSGTIVPTTETENTYQEVDKRLMDEDSIADIAGAQEKLDSINPADPKQASKIPLAQKAGSKLKNLKNTAKEKLNGYGKRAESDLKKMAKSKMEEAKIEAARYVNRRVPYLENIYGKVQRASDAATDVRSIAGAIESVVGKNVHFLDGTPLVDVLNKANRDALIALGNVYRR